MLSGEEIIKQIKLGNIKIEPFDEKKINPNSYNLTLNNELLIYTDPVLDCAKENKTRKIIIPEEGYTLIPGNLYQACTNEYTETNGFVPQITGRSSIGRVGLTVHITSGFGANGFKGVWTLGLSCTTPVKIFPNMQIGQIYYFPLIGETNIKYEGKYLNSREANKSKSYLDFNNI